MKLGIFCNFGPPHIGGSEVVLENIATGLIDQYGYDITIYGYNYNNDLYHKGINIVPCKKGNDLIAQINENDHIFVYSDSFWGWDTIVENIDKVVPDVSVALVGAYHMRDHNKSTGEKFKANIERFRVICHSKLNVDHEWCLDNDLSATVIPNGVNLSEFDDNLVDFREKYGIKEKYMFLNVSNFFYGKGQEALIDIGTHFVRGEIKDNYVIVQISNSVNYPYDRRFLERCKKESKDKNVNIKFLRDIPREDVVAAFKSAGAFLFTSRKEICPLVILESQAASLPWISMKVGNVRERDGGKVIPYTNDDSKGYKIINHKTICSYVVRVVEIFEEEMEKLSVAGRKDAEMLDWKNIVPLYNEVFNG
jgi:glycosyltransferase involved in cell wall biosynthesis